MTRHQVSITHVDEAPARGERDLIQELRDYTENWVNRMRLLKPAHEPQAIAREVFDELLLYGLSPSHSTLPLPRQIHDFIMSHLRHGVSLKDLSKFLGYSEKYCSELFQTQMGESFSAYLRHVRIEKAKRLLEDEAIGLTHIADELGFGDQFAFSHFFKKTTGQSPRQYRVHVHKKLKVHSKTMN
ncbi:MAG: hypothetical protein NPIRA02_31360 [Nitrospirales bacterium]|nr:MAG: hypothetical protein NPIRA02_31360 [Nitrospirales bacterium]